LAKCWTRPIRVDAIKYTGKNWLTLHFMRKGRHPWILAKVDEDLKELAFVYKKTHVLLPIGHYAVRDSDGYLTTCSPERFGYMYEVINDDRSSLQARVRPNEVDAFQWTDREKDQVGRFFRPFDDLTAERSTTGRGLRVHRKGQDSPVLILKGEYLVRDGDGHITRMPADRFGYYFVREPWQVQSLT